MKSYLLLVFGIVFLAMSCQPGSSGGNSSDTTTDIVNDPIVDDPIVDDPASPALSSIALTQEKTTFITDDLSDIQFTATATYSNDSTTDVTTTVAWSSSDESVAIVNTQGTATPKGRGIATITASLDEKTDSGTLEGYYPGEESSKDNPILIETPFLMPTIYNGQVNNGINYYCASGLNQTNLSVTLSGLTYDADLYIYSDSDFTQQVRRPYYGRTFSEISSGLAGFKVDDQYLYFSVNGEHSPYGADFTLTIIDEGNSESLAPGCNFDRGAPENPIQITDIYISYRERVETYSYYKLVATAGNTYWISLTGLDDDVDLDYFGDDSTFTTIVSSSTNSGADAEYLEVTLNTDNAYFRVSDQAAGECFQISFQKGEGSVEHPVSLYTEKYNVALVSDQSSYFIFPVSQGTSYTATIAGDDSGGSLGCDADLYLYDDDSSFTTAVACSGLPKDSTTDAESCTDTAGGSSYYIKISKGSGCTEKGTSYYLTLIAN
ncbi:PPC domain-containing protein [bacterium]|nr:PPC domain-containing protein [bacterium]